MQLLIFHIHEITTTFQLRSCTCNGLRESLRYIGTSFVRRREPRPSQRTLKVTSPISQCFPKNKEANFQTSWRM